MHSAAECTCGVWEQNARAMGEWDDEAREWSGTPDPSDPDNYWIDDTTGERVNAHTGERIMRDDS